MNAPSNSLGILDGNGKVVTFVRSDVPSGWQPPSGCTAVPSDQLPVGWEYVAPVVQVPASVTRRQLKQWLILDGRLSAVTAALAGIPDATQRALAQVWWDDATEFERSHPLVAQVGGAIGMTSEQIDAAFIAAAAL